MAGVLSPNAKKVAPGFNHGTPSLGFYKLVVSENLETLGGGYAASDSHWSKAVNVLQNWAELYGLGTPSGTAGFVFVVNANSFNPGSAASFADIEAQVDAISGLSSAAITALSASGASIA